MKRKKKYFVIILISFFLLFLLFQFLIGLAFCKTSFGIQPMTHQCIGLEISSEKTIKLFPKGDIEFNIFISYLRYCVPDKISHKDIPFCLGQDLRYCVPDKISN